MLNSPRPKNWWVYPRLPDEVDRALSVFPPYMRQLLFNRGCNDASSAAEYLNATQPLGDPFLLTDMDKAIERLLLAIDNGEPIVVYGDYDVDGVSATALMVQVLQKFTPRVARYIPNRFDEGYGVNSEAIQLLADSGAKLILTVDCGIRSPKEAALASSLGVDMIISDHHYPQGDLPPALAVICPKREGDAYPDKDLAGVGLAYKIAQALFARRKAGDWSADDWLDFVALGTVADVVPLHGENRVLVRRGINLIRQGKRVGLQALIRVSGRDPQRINASDIGFMLGPRLNAAGRMESALQAYSLLMADSLDDAAMLAQKLDNQNSERQKVTKEMRAMAEDHFGPEPESNILTTFEETYNAGVMGLVAANLVEAYYRPAIVGCIDGDVIRASCRSIEEFHITQALDQCSDLLVRHGGHAMAAGFTLEKANALEFLARIEAVADKQLAGRQLRKTVKADLEMSIEMVKDVQLRDLEKLQPTGMENPDAVFISRNVEIKGARAIGADKKHLKMTCQAGYYLLDAVAWRQADWLPMLPGKFDLLYNIEENNYMGSRSLQLVVRDMRPSGS